LFCCLKSNYPKLANMASNKQTYCILSRFLWSLIVLNHSPCIMVNFVYVVEYDSYSVIRFAIKRDIQTTLTIYFMVKVASWYIMA